MGEVWVPGAAGPQDVFVARIVARIEAFVERYGAEAADTHASYESGWDTVLKPFVEAASA